MRSTGLGSLKGNSMKTTAAALLVLVLLCISAWGDYGARPEVQDYIDDLVADYGFGREWLIGVFAGAKKNDKVIERISTPAEKVLAWRDYRKLFVTEKRINGGVEFWRRNRAALDAAQDEYGVAGEIVVAVLGVETLYGRHRGSYRVIDALATLAFDYPPRSKFFKRELTEFLLLAREEDKDPFEPMGSYAGAMGYGQFISSSYRSFAVDFDSDGQRDIWNNETDAIGSVANYFVRHGWRGEGQAAVKVTLRDQKAAELANAGLDLKHTVGELRQRGILGLDELGAEKRAALFRMEAEDGVEYWLGLHDFYVVTRYNRSSMYALAVLQLSAAIRARFEQAESS